MNSHRFFRLSIFIMAMLVGLLREGIAQGHTLLTPADKASPACKSGEISQR